MLYDALIIGAGPAGSSAARLLAQAGWRVALVEKAEFPRRKVCGEFISATTMPVLKDCGVAVPFIAAAGPPVTRVGIYAGTTTLAAPREQRFLQYVDRLTKQKVEIGKLPTEADLRKRRLEAAKDSIRERITAGGLEDTRELVESLAQEFEMIDIAAAAVAMANESADKTVVADIPVADERQPRSYDAPQRDDRGSYDRAPRSASRAPRDEGPMTLLRISVGKEESIRPADIVGAIAGEAKIPSGVIGAIKIHDDYSLVEIPDEHAERVITALKRTQIRGHKVTVQSKPAR